MSKTKLPGEAFDLKSKPVRPLDPANLSNDQATLRALAGQLNETPRGVDPNAPVDTTEYSGPVGAANRTLPLDTLPDESALQRQLSASRPPVPTPAPITEPTPPLPPAPLLPAAPRARRLVLTGRDIGTVAGLLGATLFSLSDRATALAVNYFPSVPRHYPGFQQFIETVFAWGADEVTDKYPITVERALFVKQASEYLPGFGSNAGFWTDDAVKAIKALPPEGNLVMVAGIPDLVALRYFQAMGFQHWHITGPSQSPERLMLDSFSAGLDQEVIKAISLQRQGPKLRSIWNAEPAPSSRLWSLAEFIASYR